MKTLSSLLAALILCAGCSTTNFSQGDAVLLGEDLRDLAREASIYALAEKPEWRESITLVRNQLSVVATELQGPVTIDTIITIIQQLPIEELQSNEARLAITGGKIILRRAGRNVNLGDVSNLAPLAQGLAAGLTEGLNYQQPVKPQTYNRVPSLVPLFAPYEVTDEHLFERIVFTNYPVIRHDSDTWIYSHTK